MTARTIVKGVVPVGGIIPIASHLTGAYSIPATGTVDGDGWMYCDGSAIPAGNILSGNVPQLTDERFLVGSSTAGSTGGANSITPAGSVSGTNAGSQSIAHTHTLSHTHGMDHNHQVAYIGGSKGVIFMHTSSANQATWSSFSTGNGFLSHDNAYDYNVAYTGDAYVWSSGSGGMYTSGVLNPEGGTAVTDATTSEASNTTTSGMSANSTVSGSNFTWSGSFTGTPFNNRPLYLSVKYLIRVR